MGQSDDEDSKKGEETKRAVVRKRGKDGNSKVAVFDIQGARQRAGDWITTVKKDLERRFKRVEVLQTQEDGEDENKKSQKQTETAKKKNMFDKMGEGLENIHPLHVMNENLKDKIKETAMGNRRKIVALLVESCIYCCIFDLSKKGLKKVTKHRKYTGPTVKFVSDVALPTGLYGPIFGFLVRLALPF